MRARRTILAILLPVSMTVPALAQSWCTPEATWTYTYSNGWTHVGFAQFTYTGVALLNDTVAQRIAIHMEGVDLPNSTPFSWEDSAFTNVNDDLVSIWTGTRFDTLFPFGAVPGDQWSRTMPNDEESWQFEQVLDTGTLVIDGVPLHYLAMASGDTLMERLGSLYTFMLPWVAVLVDAPGGPLRCYHDGEIDHAADWWTFGCASWLAAPHPDKAAAITLSPNPGNDQLTIHGLSSPSAVRIQDMTGRISAQRTGLFDPAIIATDGLPAGTYTIQVVERDGSTRNLRWVKQK